jgi:hypothetical protein
MSVTLLPATGFAGFEGVDVFVHPTDVDLSTILDLMILDSPGREAYFAVWFMELSKECACGWSLAADPELVDG